MALYTTTANGNWSGAIWTPSPPAGGPGNGDTVQLSHNVTIDAACGASQNGVLTIGNSLLNSLVGSSSYGTGGAAPTGLTTGTYRFYITITDTGAKESPVNTESTFALTNGTNARLTMPAVPTGGSSLNLYLSAAGGSANTETLYCSGITATTLDLTSSGWMNTAVAGVASGGATAQGSATAFPATNKTNAITVAASKTITGNANCSLRLRGNLTQSIGAATDTYVGPFTITYDSSQSASPSTTTYSYAVGNPRNLILSGSNGNRITVTSDNTNSAANGTMSLTSGSQTGQLTATYTDFSNLGTASSNMINTALTSGTTNTFSLSNCTVTNCGLITVSVGGGAGTQPTCNLTNVTFTGSLNTNCVSLTSNGTIGNGTRTMVGNYFDKTAAMNWQDWTVTGNVFMGGWAATGAPWASFSNNFVRILQPGGAPAASDQVCFGDVSNTYVFFDNLSGSVTTITGCANNGSGRIRVTTSSAHGYSTGFRVWISGVVGTTETLGQWDITVVDTTRFDLNLSTFTNAYVSGGTATSLFINPHGLDCPPTTVSPYPTSFTMTGLIVDAMASDSQGDCTLFGNFPAGTSLARSYLFSSSAFTTQLPANAFTQDAMTLMGASPAVDDAIYFGITTITNIANLVINITTPGVWVGTLAWEYWNGSAWTVLSGLSDGSSGLTVKGSCLVSFTAPAGWTTTTVNAVSSNYIRARIATFTSMSTQAKAENALFTTFGRQASFLTKSIILPDAVTKHAAGCLMTWLGNPVMNYTCEHNTYVAPLQAADMCETFHSYYHGMLSFRANLAWGYTVVGPTPQGGSNGVILLDSGHVAGADPTPGSAPGPIVTDVVDPTMCDYNAGWNVQTTRAATAWFTNQGRGYAAKFSSTPGVHDIAVNTQNPNFVDPDRNFLKWDLSLGGAGTNTSAYARLQASPSTAIPALLAYVRAGFRPTNSAYANASYPGDATTTDAAGNPMNGTIGAMAALLPPGSFNINTPYVKPNYYNLLDRG